MSDQTAANIHYTPHGAMDQLKLGNGLFEQTNFNPRLQVTGINLGTSLGSNSVWGIGNGYAASGYNNGNLLTHSITVQGVSLAAQTFLYDPVNRIQVAAENPSNASVPGCPDASSHWCELFGYDNYGNRSMTQSTNVGVVAPAGFSAASNRITDSGWGYDQAGNLNQDLGGQSTYNYDAENRLVAACAYTDGPGTCTDQVAAGRTLYGYDGEGRRVTKRTADGTLTTFVYDSTGALAAEYGGVATTNGPEYLTADQLGSTRVVTNALQGIVARHDFRPFGDEIPGTGVRQGIVGYGLDGSVMQKFTGKERDGETGLDFFLARYHSAAQGRFTSVDPQNEGVQLVDPQSWNGYSYVGNNPLNRTDPDGRDYHLCIDGECRDVSDPAYDYWRRVKGKSIIVEPGGTIRDRETEIKIGKVTWFDGDAARKAQNAGAVVNFFALNQGLNMLSGVLSAWLNGLRAAAASSAAFEGGIGLQGRTGEYIVRAQLVMKGYRIVGQHVRVVTTKGVRFVDFIVEKAGEYSAVEVKTLDSPYTVAQIAKDEAMASEGAAIGLGVGRVVTELTGQIRKLTTVVIKAF